MSEATIGVVAAIGGAVAGAVVAGIFNQVQRSKDRLHEARLRTEDRAEADRLRQADLHGMWRERGFEMVGILSPLLATLHPGIVRLKLVISSGKGDLLHTNEVDDITAAVRRWEQMKEQFATLAAGYPNADVRSLANAVSTTFTTAMAHAGALVAATIGRGTMPSQAELDAAQADHDAASAALQAFAAGLHDDRI